MTGSYHYMLFNVGGSLVGICHTDLDPKLDPAKAWYKDEFGYEEPIRTLSIKEK